VLAALAFPDEDGEHVISHLELGHPLTHALYHSREQKVFKMSVLQAIRKARQFEGS
jgi:hypothetical protein